MSNRIIDLDKMQQDLNLLDMRRDEAECIIYAWLLKTKLYLIGETSHEWSEEGKSALREQLQTIAENWNP